MRSALTRAVGLVITVAMVLSWAGIPSACSEEAEQATLAPLVELLGQVDEADFQLDLLKGMREGLKGRKQAPMPAGWQQVYARLSKSPSQEVREEARLLSLVFGDAQALASLRSTLLDAKAPIEQRLAALEGLVEKHVEDLPPVLHALLETPALRGAALRGLGAYNDQATPAAILRHYARLDDSEKQDAIVTLASRPAYALRLLEAIEKQQVPRSDVTTFTARQLLDLKNERVTARLKEVWGEVRPASAEKQQTIARYKGLLTEDFLKTANLSHGRYVFSRTCMQCHKLYGEGGTIGPDLTGSNRANLDYILENAIDPSASIGRDYRLTNVLTEDGRLLSGIVVGETAKSLTLRTVNEQIVLDKAEIDERRESPLSMMPEGQLDQLAPEYVRDLIAYLATQEQVPLPEEQPELAAPSTEPRRASGR